MTDILLPTQQLNLLSTHTQRGVSNRAVAPTPNDKIAFQIDNAKKLAPLTDAIDVIDKFQEKIKKEKQEALINQASNLYKEVVGSEAIRYQNLKGDEAVKGLDEHNKNLDSINKQFSHTFKNVEMQMVLDKSMQNTNLNARLNGENWHNKQVIEVANQERLATLQVTGEQYIHGLGTPNDKNNLAEMNNAMRAVIVKNDGISDVNSNAYKVKAQQYYDTAFKQALANQIQKNPSMAMTNLNRVKGLISQDLYDKLVNSCKDEQEAQYYKALQIQKLTQEITDAKKEAEYKFYSNPMGYADWSNIRDEQFKGLLDKYTKEHKIQFDVNKFTQEDLEKKIPKEDLSSLFKEATAYADRRKDVHDLNAFTFKDTDSRMKLMVQDELSDLIETDNYDYNAPLANLTPKSRQMLEDRYGADKAEDLVRAKAHDLYVYRDSTTGDALFQMAKRDQLQLYSDKQGLQSYYERNHVSFRDRKKFDDHCKKLLEGVYAGTENLEERGITAQNDFIAEKVVGEKKFSNVKNIEDINLIADFKEIVQQKINERQQKNKGIPVTSDEIKNIVAQETVYSLPSLKKAQKEFDEMCDSVFETFTNENGVNEGYVWLDNERWDSDDKRKQLIKEKGLEYKKRYGVYPKKEELIEKVKHDAFDARESENRFIGKQYWGDTKRANGLFGSFRVKKPLQVSERDYRFDLSTRN